MLKITKIEGYAFQILNGIADSDPSALHSSKKLAAQVNLPLPTVSKILKLLTQNNILISYQGSKGGYTLMHPANEISVADILEAFGGPLALTDCCSEAGCPRNCTVSPSWKKMNDVVESLLKNLTLADLDRPCSIPVKTIHLIFFSPTRTTQSTLEAIAEGAGCTAGITVDLTRETPTELPRFGTDDLVLIGMPVYAGRLPALAVERFQAIKGQGARAVPIVVYGNRHYDDALIELYDLCRKQDFRPIAAATFLGEHSFSTTALPLSPGRPDSADLEKATKFGTKLDCLERNLEQVPGNRPYKERMQPTGSATSVNDAACTQCGICIERCPTGGMHLTAVEADPDHCIWCMACERYCPENARSLTHEKVKASAQKLHQLFSERREPEMFFGV